MLIDKNAIVNLHNANNYIWNTSERKLLIQGQQNSDTSVINC